MNKFFSLFLAFIIFSPTQSIAGDSHYGIYSDLNSENGEPSGFEVILLNDGRPGGCDQSVIFQVAEGWPQYPELLDCCKCAINHIEFSSKKWGKFVGEIRQNSLVGEFLEAKHKISLKKGQSFWQKQWHLTSLSKEQSLRCAFYKNVRR